LEIHQSLLNSMNM